MKLAWRSWAFCFLAFLFALIGDIHLAAAPASEARSRDQNNTGWYFAVSGDSRDCGDLIMPKIAKSIEASGAQTPVQFYWHLGDLRRMFDIDCDFIKRTRPDYDCKNRQPGVYGPNEIKDYLAAAWDDFVEHQVTPFGNIPFVIGIGNHELLANRTRDEFRQRFRLWLTAQTLQNQRAADAARGLLTNEGDTYYHFIKDGVDFIYLDDADRNQFTSAQITWLARVLSLDQQDDSVKTIVAGMHAALPYSTSRNHAMDATCQGLCSGQQAYDLLYRAQGLAGPPANQKHVYVLASHSHYFQENIYDTPEHRGQVLPGWIIGTAGAEQYVDTIKYGYALVTVRLDGTLGVEFKQVMQASLPLASGPGASELTSFCFEQNKRPAGIDDSLKGNCACGEAK
jgi:hypothetical protein